MHLPSRRRFLVTGLSLAAGAFLPIEMTHSAGLDELEARALAISRTVAEELGPAAALQKARGLHHLVSIALTTASRDYQRHRLLRASSSTALTAARASRWAGEGWTGWLIVAENAAKEANDGPLLAMAMLERARAESEVTRLADQPFPAQYDLAIAALDHLGSSTRATDSETRALARYRLAWELAAQGQRYEALAELATADMDAERAGWSAERIAASRGNPLRRLGRLDEAEHSLAAALA
jgi:hypothetical protein